MTYGTGAADDPFEGEYFDMDKKKGQQNLEKKDAARPVTTPLVAQTPPSGSGPTGPAGDSRQDDYHSARVAGKHPHSLRHICIPTPTGRLEVGR